MGVYSCHDRYCLGEFRRGYEALKLVLYVKKICFLILCFLFFNVKFETELITKDLNRFSLLREILHSRCDFKVMEDVLGFHVNRTPSVVGGTGVAVFGPRHCKNTSCSVVKEGQLVGLYPGTTYLPMQPIFFQSIGNPFIFRCADGVLIDGHDKRISKLLFK